MVCASGSKMVSRSHLGTAPIVAALVMKSIFRDEVSLGFKPALKGNGRWYALSVLVYPVTIAVVIALGLLLGASTISNFTLPELLTALVPLAVTYFIFAVLRKSAGAVILLPSCLTCTTGYSVMCWSV